MNTDLFLQAFSAMKPGVKQCSCKERGTERCTMDASAPMTERVSFHHLASHDLVKMANKERTSLSQHYNGMSSHHRGQDVVLYKKL